MSGFSLSVTPSKPTGGRFEFLHGSCYRHGLCAKAGQFVEQDSHRSSVVEVGRELDSSLEQLVADCTVAHFVDKQCRPVMEDMLNFLVELRNLASQIRSAVDYCSFHRHKADIQPSCLLSLHSDSAANVCFSLPQCLCFTVFQIWSILPYM